MTEQYNCTTDMESHFKVSVVVPVYNQEKYLRQCVDSIVRQTLKEIEIILVDDGSTDGSPAICDEYAARDSRVKVIHKQNAGMGVAYNTGMAESKGEYIGFVESDDWSEPEMYEKLYATAIKNNVDVAKSLFTFSGKGRNRVTSKFTKEYLGKKLTDPTEIPRFVYAHPCHWSAIYSSNFLKDNHILFPTTPGASCQDNGFNWQVFVCLKSLYIIQESLYNYRIDNPNSSWAQGMKSAINVLLMRRWIWNELLERNVDSIFFAFLTRDTFLNAFKHNYINNCHGLDKLRYTRLSSYLWKKDIKKLNFSLFSEYEKKQVQFMVKHPILYCLKGFLTQTSKI